MLQTPVKQFTDAVAMLDHYAAARARLWGPDPKPIVLVRRPPPPPPLSSTCPVDQFMHEISCGKLLASEANCMRLAKLIDAKHQLPVGSVEGRRKFPGYVPARHEWFYLLSQKWRWGFKKTASITGRDHSTVIHGARCHRKTVLTR